MVYIATNNTKLWVLKYVSYNILKHVQIDNANLFVDVGGLSLLARDLNGTSHDLQSSSLLVLAAAVQRFHTIFLKENINEINCSNYILKILNCTNNFNIRWWNQFVNVIDDLFAPIAILTRKWRP